MSMPTPPQAEPTSFPPLGPSADHAPRYERRGPRAGVVAGILGGAAAIAVTAGTIGGAVGYVVAREAGPVKGGKTVIAFVEDPTGEEEE